MTQQGEQGSVPEDTVKGLAQGVAGELISIAKDDPEAQEAAKNIASTAKIITGTLKRAVFPLAIANYGYDKFENYIKNKFSAEMTSRTLKIPAENVVDPKPSIVGPVLQGLVYAHDEDNLREMYLNLLASAMNSDTADKAHPSFVEIIKQLSSAEAQFLEIFLRTKQSTIAEVRLVISQKGEYQTKARHLVSLMDTKNNSPVAIEMMPAYIDNWIRLGLVTVDYTTYSANSKAYDWVKDRPEYKSIDVPKVAEGQYEQKLEVTKGIMERTEYGEIFCRAVGMIQ